MKAEIRLEKVANIGVATKLADGVLIGKITCEVPVTPLSIARLLNFQKQHGVLNLVVESPQAVMDFELIEPGKEEGVIPVRVIAEAPTPAPFAEVDLAMKPADDTGPAVYTAKIDGFTGEGSDPQGALFAALIAKGIVKPTENNGDLVPAEVIKVLTEQYPGNVGAIKVAEAIQKNSFEPATEISFNNNGNHAVDETEEEPAPDTGGKKRGRKKQLAEV